MNFCFKRMCLITRILKILFNFFHQVRSYGSLIALFNQSKNLVAEVVLSLALQNGLALYVGVLVGITVQQNAQL